MIEHRAWENCLLHEAERDLVNDKTDGLITEVLRNGVNCREAACLSCTFGHISYLSKILSKNYPNSSLCNFRT